MTEIIMQVPPEDEPVAKAFENLTRCKECYHFMAGRYCKRTGFRVRETDYCSRAEGRHVDP